MPVPRASLTPRIQALGGALEVAGALVGRYNAAKITIRVALDYSGRSQRADGRTFMVLKKRLMVCTAIATVTAGAALPAYAAPWTRGFVVGAYEYAFRYGGRAGFARPGEIEPGVDCPHGSTLHFSSSDQTKIAVARQKWRSQQEIDWIAVPPGLEQARSPLGARFSIW